MAVRKVSGVVHYTDENVSFKKLNIEKHGGAESTPIVTGVSLAEQGAYDKSSRYAGDNGTYVDKAGCSYALVDHSIFVVMSLTWDYKGKAMQRSLTFDVTDYMKNLYSTDRFARVPKCKIEHVLKAMTFDVSHEADGSWQLYSVNKDGENDLLAVSDYCSGRYDCSQED